MARIPEGPHAQALLTGPLCAGSSRRKAKAFHTIRSYVKDVTDIVRHGQRQGRIRSDVDAGTVAHMFLGLVLPAALVWHASDGAFDVTGHTERAFRVFVDAIGT